MSNRLTAMFQCSECGKFEEASRIPLLPFFSPRLPEGWTGSSGRDSKCMCRACTERDLRRKCNSSLCLVIALHNRKSENKPYTYNFIQSESQLDALLLEMKAKPKRFGLVLEKDFFSPVDAGRQRTLQAFILDVIPEGIDYVVCASSSWHEIGFIVPLKDAGVSILWDCEHITSFEQVLPEDVFRSHIKDGSFWKVVPDDVRAYLSFLTEREKDKAIRCALDVEFGTDKRDFEVWEHDDENCAKWEGVNLSALVNAMSFGSVTYVQNSNNSNKKCLPKWARLLVEEKMSWQSAAYTNEFCVQLKTIEDIFHIWNVRGRQSGLPSLFAPKPGMNTTQISRMKDRGADYGIEHSINALLAGVPIEDILGEKYT